MAGFFFLPFEGLDFFGFGGAFNIRFDTALYLLLGSFVMVSAYPYHQLSRRQLEGIGEVCWEWGLTEGIVETAIAIVIDATDWGTGLAVAGALRGMDQKNRVLKSLLHMRLSVRRRSGMERAISKIDAESEARNFAVHSYWAGMKHKHADTALLLRPARDGMPTFAEKTLTARELKALASRIAKAREAFEEALHDIQRELAQQRAKTQSPP